MIFCHNLCTFDDFVLAPKLQKKKRSKKLFQNFSKCLQESCRVCVENRPEILIYRVSCMKRQNPLPQKGAVYRWFMFYALIFFLLTPFTYCKSGAQKVIRQSNASFCFKSIGLLLSTNCFMIFMMWGFLMACVRNMVCFVKGSLLQSAKGIGTSDKIKCCTWLHC